MKWAGLRFLRGALQVSYEVVKAMTRVNRNKVVLLGRRMNQTPPDFTMLVEELRRQHPEIKVVVRSMLVTGQLSQLPRFFLMVMGSVYHLATAKVCVLDSYWPTASILRHRPELVVYQMWHSLGKLKQTGKQSLGRKQGRSELLARHMRMHEGYDYVVAGAPVWNPQYRAAFGVRDSQLLNFGLPRSDYLVNERDAIAARIYEAYPELRSRPVVLYAPTFRRGVRATGALDIADAIDLKKFNLVVKKHGSDNLIMPPQPHFQCPEFTGTEMLTVADFVITDYSSIALEAALIDAKTLYYLYDYDEYFQSNGVNVDLTEEMPGCVFHDAAGLASALTEEYPVEELQRYKRTYLAPNPGHATRDLANHIFEVGGLCTR